MSLPRGLAEALAPRFHVRSELGEGAAGWVVQALDAELGREVALKVARQQGTPQQLARFEREGRIAGGLQHPSIVRTHSMGQVGGHPYLVLELVPGAQTLRDHFAAAPVPARLGALTDVAAAMTCAHEAGIVHRDLKPENVLVDRMGRARVTDFGVATMRGLERMTQSGALVGTPHYMAPEQLSARREQVGPHTDVWALGVMLYEAVHGERPFEGDTLFELASAVSRGAPKRALLPGAPPAVLAVISKALAPRPNARFPHAGAFAQALQEALRGGDVAFPWRAAVALALVLAAGAAACAAMLWLGSGDPAPPAEAEPPPQTEPTVDDPATRWAKIRAQNSGVALLSAGEAWLAEFPEDPLRPKVLAALEAQRRAAPRWVHDHKQGPLQLTRTRTRLAYRNQAGTLWLREWGDDHPLGGRLFDPGRGGIVGSPIRDDLWVSGARKKQPVLLQLREGETPDKLKFHGKPVTHVSVQLAWSHDATLVAATNGYRASVFTCADLLGEQPVAVVKAWLQTAFPTVGLTFLDDASALAAVTGSHREDQINTLLILDISNGEVQGEADVPMIPACVVAVPGQRLVVGCLTGHLLLYDAHGNYEGVLLDPELDASKHPARTVRDVYAGKGCPGAVSALALSERGVLYAVCGAPKGGELRAWDFERKALICTQPTRRTYSTACLSADGRYLACATREGLIEVWDRWVEGEWAP